MPETRALTPTNPIPGDAGLPAAQQMADDLPESDDAFCPHTAYPLQVTLTLIEGDMTVRHAECGRTVLTDWPYLRAHDVPLTLAYATDDQDEDWLELRVRPAEQQPADVVTAGQQDLEAVWLTQDDEGNFGVWRDHHNARQQIARDRAAETPGVYEWVNDPDRTHELLLRDDEPTGLTLRMMLVADAEPGAGPVTAEQQQDGAVETPCVCGDPNCMPYWRPVHQQMHEMRLRSDHAAADFTKAMLEEVCEERTRAEQAEAERNALAARVAELEQALADVDMTFKLGHGGAWCASCHGAMREGTAVVKALSVVCQPCASDLAATAGRLDPSRLAARNERDGESRDQ